MDLQVSYQKYTLHFKFDAGTSRGVLKQKNIWLIRIWDKHNPQIFGIGEASPLHGLSIDDREDFEDKLRDSCLQLQNIKDLNLINIDWFSNLDLHEFPSINFAIETACLDLLNGGKRKLFDTRFFAGDTTIPINGLVWMGEKKFMQKQIEEKIQQGYTCIKIKIGALDFDAECELLFNLRKKYPSDKITLRLDANGAFTSIDALEKIKLLSEYSIHSLEQPVKPGSPELMKKICHESMIPIALDEELIGIYEKERKEQLLNTIMPDYIILKPTLVGGLNHCTEWISIAENLNIGWWITSALESNVGLNAIAQYTSTLKIGNMPQGLGTGQLYLNNVPSPLVIDKGSLRYDFLKTWDLEKFNQNTKL